MQRTRTITDKIDNITLVHDRYRSEVLPAPISVKIELASTCPWKCSFCVKSIREDSRIMNRAFFSRAIREMRDAGVEELGVFFIGESFMCKWLHEAIYEAKHEVGFPYVFLTTNGSAATPTRIKQCMDAGLDSLKFSVNFADDEQFEKIAQVDRKLRYKGLEMLKEARRIRDEGGYDCGIFASYIRFDGEQGEKMKAVLDDIRPYCDEIYALPLYGMSGATNTNLVQWRPKPGNPGRADMLRPSLPCHSVFTEGFVTVDGKLTACCFGTGIEDGSLIIADLNEVSFMEGWNNVAFQELRRAHLKGDVRGTGCEHCIAGGS